MLKLIQYDLKPLAHTHYYISASLLVLVQPQSVKAPMEKVGS